MSEEESKETTEAPAVVETTDSETPATPPAKISKGKDIAGKFGLLFFTLLIFFVLFEIVLRGKKTEFSIATDPNYDRQERNYYPEEGVMNPWVKEGEEHLVVAVVGDSFTNGAGVPYQDKYAVRLETLLNLNDDVPPAAVKIKAKGGTSTYDHYRYLEQVVKWDPDVVILGICLNDAEDTQVTETHTAWRASGVPQPPTGFMKWLTGWSKVASYIYTKKEAVRAMRAHEDYYQLLYQEDYHGFQKFKQYLGEMKKELDSRDIKFYAMIWPLLGDLNPATYKYDNIHEIVHGVLEGHGIPYVDLRDKFVGRNATRLQAVPFVDGHPNEIGHRIASEVLYRSLLNEKIIPADYYCKNASGPISGDYSRRYKALNPTVEKEEKKKE